MAAAADYGCLFKGRSVLRKFGGAAERLGDYAPKSIHKHQIHHTCYKISMSAPFRHFASFILEIALAIPDLAPITRPFHSASLLLHLVVVVIIIGVVIQRYSRDAPSLGVEGLV